MTKTSKPLTFFGSGPVAARTLDFLSDIFNISCIVTKPRPTHHKDPAPVEIIAKSKSIKILYANNSHQIETLIQSNSIDNSLGIVVDYGVILSQKVISHFKYGIINSHFSLLPEWKGADPITYALLSGQRMTGVSLMSVNSRLDEGLILAQVSIPISEDDDSHSLTDKLIKNSNRMMQEYLPTYISGQLKANIRLTEISTFSRKITKQDGELNWNKPATVIEREIRSFSVWPKCHCNFNNFDIVIVKASARRGKSRIGELYVKDSRLFVGCRFGILEILEIKPAGKKSMSAKSFINGYLNHSTS